MFGDRLRPAGVSVDRLGVGSQLQGGEPQDLARARASGRKLGRPEGSLGVSRLDGKEDEIRRFLELGVSKTAIAKITGVSRTALYSFMSTRGLRPSRLRVRLTDGGGKQDGFSG